MTDQSTNEPLNEDGAAWCGEAPPTDRKKVDAALKQLSAHWKKEHKGRREPVRQALAKQFPSATADERLLLDQVAHDSAIAESLGNIQVELVGRIAALIDNLETVSALSKALRDIMTCRSAATSRVDEALLAAGALRSQRLLAQPPTRLRAA